MKCYTALRWPSQWLSFSLSYAKIPKKYLSITENCSLLRRKYHEVEKERWKKEPKLNAINSFLEYVNSMLYFITHLTNSYKYVNTTKICPSLAINENDIWIGRFALGWFLAAFFNCYLIIVMTYDVQMVWTICDMAFRIISILIEISLFAAFSFQNLFPHYFMSI